MKRVLPVLLVASLLTACNENGVSIENKTDSLGQKLDSLGNKIENKAEQIWDSTKVKAGELKDKAEQKWDSTKVDNRRNDTVNKQ